MKRLILIFLIAFYASFGWSQVMIGVKLIGLSFHLKKNPHPYLYKLKMDGRGYSVINTGVVFCIEYFVYQNIISVKYAQGFFYDCARQPAGFIHFGPRIHGYWQNHQANIGNGPTLFYRKDWSSLHGYINEGLFKEKNGYQYRFFWYAGEVEYNYCFHQNHAFSTTFIPGPPEFFTVAPGWKTTLH